MCISGWKSGIRIRFIFKIRVRHPDTRRFHFHFSPFSIFHFQFSIDASASFESFAPLRLRLLHYISQQNHKPILNLSFSFGHPLGALVSSPASSAASTLLPTRTSARPGITYSNLHASYHNGGSFPATLNCQLNSLFTQFKPVK